LLDGVVILNKVIDEVNRQKKEYILFKVDFEKAYNTIDWKYLTYIIGRLDFCSKWIKDNL